MKTNLIGPLGLVSLIALSSATPAFADFHRERDHWHGEIRYFHEHDLRLWRAGHWYHGLHGGRAGWWWIVNGIWSFYPRRVAVIPDPYVPPTVITVQPAAPPPVVVQEAPPAGAAAATWYYCNSPHGYYPYVTSCPGGWSAVPATPPPAPPGG
jgi:hypothetical protein